MIVFVSKFSVLLIKFFSTLRFYSNSRDARKMENLSNNDSHIAGHHSIPSRVSSLADLYSRDFANESQSGFSTK